MSQAPHRRLVLASASPRRLALLGQIGIVPDATIAPHIDESTLPRELPVAAAARIAAAKAAAVEAQADGAYVLAADTVVACGQRILPKAGDEAAARRCLALLSGRRHRVHTAVTVLTPDRAAHHRLVTTVVTVKRLTPAEIAWVLASGEWEGKAGGYAIQGRFAALVRRINGSYSNVVGLPLAETAALLEGRGFPVTRAAARPVSRSAAQ